MKRNAEHFLGRNASSCYYLERKRRTNLYVFLNIFLCFFVFFSTSSGQAIRAAYEETVISQDQPLVLTVRIQSSDKRPLVRFPNLEGFDKRSIVATTTTSVVAGQTTEEHRISQQYWAKQEGKLVLAPSIVQVGNDRIEIAAASIEVKPPQATSVPLPTGFEEELRDIESLSGQEVFFSVKPSRTSVYVREGFGLRISLFIRKGTRQALAFYQLNRQLDDILKKLKPSSCWEEHVPTEEVLEADISIGGQVYTEYQLYKSVLFPITKQSITFPSVKLDLLLTQENEAKPQVVSYYSRATYVQVKPLPKHPQAEVVPVGQYQLSERLSAKQVAVGESINYMFRILGKGNIHGLSMLPPLSSSVFDVYPPATTQVVRQTGQQVNGEKKFDYLIVPKQNGSHALGAYFQWVYFDPVLAQYDTLRSDLSLVVSGERPQAGSMGTGALYDDIERLDTSPPYTDYQELVRTLINIVLLILLAGAVWLFRK